MSDIGLYKLSTPMCKVSMSGVEEEDMASHWKIYIFVFHETYSISILIL